MRHNMSVLMAILPQANDTVFQKTLAFSDFYFGADDWNYPLGLVQMCAKSHADQIRGEALPEWLEWLPEHAVRSDGAALDGLLAPGRGSAASGQSDLLPRTARCISISSRPIRRRSLTSSAN